MKHKKDISNFCPVCGFDIHARFGFKPWDEDSPSDEICPSCGIQFGYSDSAGGDVDKRKIIYDTWRKEWIDAGMAWYSKGSVPPSNWDPKSQLKNILDENDE